MSIVRSVIEAIVEALRISADRGFEEFDGQGPRKNVREVVDGCRSHRQE